jgi:hypothetical protein
MMFKVSRLKALEEAAQIHVDVENYENPHLWLQCRDCRFAGCDVERSLGKRTTLTPFEQPSVWSHAGTPTFQAMRALPLARLPLEFRAPAVISQLKLAGHKFCGMMRELVDASVRARKTEGGIKECLDAFQDSPSYFVHK